MNKKFLIFLLLVFVSNPKNISAHSLGQPPNFKINGLYAKLYPVYSSSTDNFTVPQDIAPDNYLVNQNINFEIDTKVLGLPEDIINNTEFTWDFGDGQKDKGISNEHAYKKMGTYVLTIYSNDNISPQQIFEAIAINVLPDINYKLPEVKIKVNGRQSQDPLTDIFRLNFSKEITFEAEKSEGSAKIISYYWDFGDQKSSNEENAKHTYESDLIQVFPLLEIKDENGFIADNYVQLENEKLGKNQIFQNKNNNSSADSHKSSTSQLKYTIILITVGIFLTYIIFKSKRGKNK